jgi:hypothetical protein
VYAALDPYGANVVGGRATGVGVGGFILGGGYSWLSNQYGLVPLFLVFYRTNNTLYATDYLSTL